MQGRHRSSATGLALVYAALVLYASLYPFEGWRWPPGQGFAALALLPTAQFQSRFDVVTNLLGYAPLGLLVGLAALRSGWRLRHAGLLTLGVAAALSWGCELLQHFVPGRVPSREDLAFNTAGGCIGGVLALAAQVSGLVERWNGLRRRWFARDAALALVLLVLWPVALLFPTPVALGLGQLGPQLAEWLAVWLDGVPWAEPVWQHLVAPSDPQPPLRPLAETALVAAGMLAPCLVAYSVVEPAWRRIAMSVGALLLAGGAMTLSTLLNFGPDHALAWLGPRSTPGLLLGALLACALAPLPRRVVAGIGLIVLTALLFGVAQAPEDPYFAQSLLGWEQGRFVRFHGLAQWIGWLWPYAAIGWMLSRLASRAP
jgi:VanZ family protein